MMEMIAGYAGWAVLTAGMVAYVYGADKWIEAAVDAAEAFFWPEKSEPKFHGDLIALYGEAVDA